LPFIPRPAKRQKPRQLIPIGAEKVHDAVNGLVADAVFAAQPFKSLPLCLQLCHAHRIFVSHAQRQDARRFLRHQKIGFPFAVTLVNRLNAFKVAGEIAGILVVAQPTGSVPQHRRQLIVNAEPFHCPLHFCWQLRFRERRPFLNGGIVNRSQLRQPIAVAQPKLKRPHIERNGDTVTLDGVPKRFGRKRQHSGCCQRPKQNRIRRPLR
jgi:diadenosine tetraphosphatase ApaH/serine/threonine PP2A family protein phosphatase